MSSHVEPDARSSWVLKGIKNYEYDTIMQTFFFFRFSKNNSFPNGCFFSFFLGFLWGGIIMKTKKNLCSLLTYFMLGLFTFFDCMQVTKKYPTRKWGNCNPMSVESKHKNQTDWPQLHEKKFFLILSNDHWISIPFVSMWISFKMCVFIHVVNVMAFAGSQCQTI